MSENADPTYEFGVIVIIDGDPELRYLQGAKPGFFIVGDEPVALFTKQDDAKEAATTLAHQYARLAVRVDIGVLVREVAIRRGGWNRRWTAPKVDAQ